jgi:hypothetical protein
MAKIITIFFYPFPSLPTNPESLRVMLIFGKYIAGEEEGYDVYSFDPRYEDPNFISENFHIRKIYYYRLKKR